METKNLNSKKVMTQLKGIQEDLLSSLSLRKRTFKNYLIIQSSKSLNSETGFLSFLKPIFFPQDVHVIVFPLK